LTRLILISTVFIPLTVATALAGFQNESKTTDCSSAKTQQTSKNGQDSFFKNPYNFQDTLLVVNAILVDSVGLSPYCGIAIIRVTYKFEIENVAVGTYFNKYIKVQFQCPREMGDSYFQKGKRYHLTVQKIVLKDFKNDTLGQKLSDNIPIYKYCGTF